MSDNSEDPEAAAGRLDAALERIAQAATRGDAAPSAPVASRSTEEVAARLDGLIDRLRSALGGKAD